MSEDNTRPVSVAELLARNGTIGSPPVGGHRRRKRRNAVSVAELTGEIPVIRTGEIPVVVDDEQDEYDEVADSAEVSSETVVVYSSTADYSATSAGGDTYAEDTSAGVAPDYSDYRDYTPVYDPTTGDSGVATTEYAATEYAATEYAATEYAEARIEYAEYTGATTRYTEPEPASGVLAEPEVAVSYPARREPVPVSDEVPFERPTEPRSEAAPPPLSSIPLPRPRRGPERSHDPRPRRRSTGPEQARRSPAPAEQMSPDPVDEAVDLAELVAEQVPAPAELRSYLKSSAPTLFFGETVADDLARRGEVAEPDWYGGSDDSGDSAGYDYDDGGDGYEADDMDDDDVDAPRRGALSVLGTSLVAVVQSLLAVVFGAGLFIGFDQLWRWNNIVALALSALVIAALMVGVHVVRKTEDFVSTLIAALVGILVTFGPLALQST
jgi:hypothetical protein